MPSRRERRMLIRIRRKRRAKRKKAEGFAKVIEHHQGHRKVRFVKPATV